MYYSYVRNEKRAHRNIHRAFDRVDRHAHVLLPDDGVYDEDGNEIDAPPFPGDDAD